ncbi:MFS transporter [Corticibacterium sp. UT-5YL-CI-8]|nr:MFS transporter [Tianweitania sp. UT-5YL-CI-8]
MSDSTASGPAYCPASSRPYVLVSAILASSMGFIDGSVVSLAMPVIRRDLDASLIDAQWISNAYMLFLAALVLLGGAAGDVFGIRRIFVAGIAFFVATSIGCTFATSAEMLIGMRAAQGIGAAFMVPSSLAIIAKSYPPDIRGKAIGQWAAFSSLTTALGPFVGGMVLSIGADWVWRLVFAINLPIGAVALWMLLAKVPDDRPAEHRRLDWPGAALATGGLGFIAWGLTDFGVAPESQLASPWLWVCIGVALFAVFIAWERRAAEPMVKLELFASRAFSGANLYTLVLYFGFTAVLFFLPMTVVSGWGVPEWQVSLVFLPLSASIALFSSAAGRLADRIGPRLPLTLGAAIVCVAYTGLTLSFDAMQLWTVTFPFLVLSGIGMACLVSPLSTAVMMATPDEDTGLASGINNAVARAAGLLAVAGLGAIAGIVFGAMAGMQVPGVEFGGLLVEPLDPAAETLRIDATNNAFQAVAGAAAFMALIAALLAWTTQPSWPAKSESLSKAAAASDEGL